MLGGLAATPPQIFDDPAKGAVFHFRLIDARPRSTLLLLDAQRGHLIEAELVQIFGRLGLGHLFELDGGVEFPKPVRQR